MSLYSGISFNKGEAPVVPLTNQPAGGQDAGGPPSTSTTADEPKKANWSSALAFAPIRRPAANKLKPPRPSAAFHFHPTPGVDSGSKPTDAVRSAEAVLNPSTTRTADALGVPSNESTVEQATRTLPALMIEEDANKKRPQPTSGGVEAGGGKGRRKKKSKREAEKPSFNPLEPYDPSKPNDIEEYTRWRAEIKRQKEEEKRQQRDHVKREQSESEGSYYSEDERDEVVTGYKGGFAPPASYDSTNHSSAVPPVPSPAPVTALPSAIPRDLTGDEAYARRVALSSGARMPTLVPPTEASTGPSGFVSSQEQPSVPSRESIQERIDRARQNINPASAPAPGPTTQYFPPASAPVSSFVGQQVAAPPPPPPPTSTFTPITFARPSDPRYPPPPQTVPGPSPHYPVPRSHPASPLDPRASAFVPPFASAYGSPHPSPYTTPKPPPPPPTLPVSNPYPPPAVPPASKASQSVPSDDFQRIVEESKAKAAAIAAKFAKPPSFGGVAPILGKSLLSGPSADNSDKPALDDGPTDTRDFATRMMEKWGHKEGQGLGVNAEGIVAPIEVVQTKQARSKGSYEGSSQAPRAPAAMGKIVSETTARKDAEDRERFGESSRVITLQHLVGGPEEVDEYLSDEIAGECSKHGVVERVVLHQVSPVPVRPEDAVVVFVVFSGPAGAWTAIRALNDRFFGGNKVVARYFAEARFARGERDC